MVPIGTALLSIGERIIEKIFPDPKAAAEAKLKLMELEQAGQLKIAEFDNALALAQTEINKIEAADPNIFKSGWRPFVGWLCGISLAYTYLLQPILTAVFAKYGMVLPQTNASELTPILLALLGLGTMRSFEKFHGKS